MGTDTGNAGVDPGFPPAILQGAPTYHFTKFSQKMHEIEKKSGGGGAHLEHRLGINHLSPAQGYCFGNFDSCLSNGHLSNFQDKKVDGEMSIYDMMGSMSTQKTLILEYLRAHFKVYGD